MNKIVLFSLLMLQCFSIVYSEKISIAVNDLVGQGIDKNTAAVISERIRVELINTQSFRVMERSQMKAILEEQGFQKSDVCNSSECIVEMGQLLGVEHMIMGSIGLVGSMYTISLRLVNVATGEVLFTASEDCKCPIEDVLTTSTLRIAAKLDLAIQKSVFGTLDLKTIPQGATVIIKGKKIGETDYRNERFVPGKYNLLLTMPTYDSTAKDISIEKNKAVILSYKLKHTKAYQDSVRKATRKQRLKKIIIRQSILGVLTLASGGIGLYYNNEADKALSNERTAKEAYENAPEGSDFNVLYSTYEGYCDDVDKNIIYRNIAYGITGAFTVSFGISFAF